MSSESKPTKRAPAPRKRASRKATPKPSSSFRASDLRSDYERLGELLACEADGSKAAALVRERRMIGELLESIETPKGSPLVDQLAERRRAATGDSGATARRRRPG